MQWLSRHRVQYCEYFIHHCHLVSSLSHGRTVNWCFLFLKRTKVFSPSFLSLSLFLSLGHIDIVIARGTRHSPVFVSCLSPYAALFCTGACVSWLVQFRSKLRKNVMSVDEIEHGWTSENRARLGFSFFLVVAALSLFILNIILILMANKKICQRKHTRPMLDKNSEGVIMLY